MIFGGGRVHMADIVHLEGRDKHLLETDDCGGYRQSARNHTKGSKDIGKSMLVKTYCTTNLPATENSAFRKL